MNGDEEKYNEEPEEIAGGMGGALEPLNPEQQVVLWDQVAKNAEKMIEAKQKIWSLILKIAKPGDWMAFESNGTKKASIGFAGSLRIASIIGISFTDWSKERVTGRDDKGDWYRWDMECTAQIYNRKVRVYGRAGSRDKFFGKKAGEYKELSDINEGDVRMAAWHNAQKEGVKALLGLHSIPTDEIQNAGIKLEEIKSYAFSSNDDTKKSGQKITILVANVTTSQTKSGKSQYHIHDSVGKKYTSWSSTDAQTAKQAKEQNKKLHIDYEVNKFGNTVQSVRIATVSEDNPF